MKLLIDPWGSERNTTVFSIDCDGQWCKSCCLPMLMVVALEKSMPTHNPATTCEQEEGLLTRCFGPRQRQTKDTIPQFRACWFADSTTIIQLSSSGGSPCHWASALLLSLYNTSRCLRSCSLLDQEVVLRLINCVDVGKCSSEG